MSSIQRELAHLFDIVRSALLIQEFIQSVDEATFQGDRMRQDAVIRRIEIIGEATRRISATFRTAHPEIPWQQMAGMRSKLIHAYDRGDLVEVWNVAQRDVPVLLTLLRPLVPPDEPDEEWRQI